MHSRVRKPFIFALVGSILLSSATALAASLVDQGQPGQLPWPVKVVPAPGPFPDGGSGPGSSNVNPAAMTNGQISQVLCGGAVPTLIDGNPRRYLLIVNPTGGDTVWVGNTPTMTIPASSFPLPGGASYSVDASSTIPFYCLDPSVALPDGGGSQLDGGGIFFSEVL